MPHLLNSIHEVAKEISNVSTGKQVESGLSIIADQLDAMIMQLEKISTKSPEINIEARLPEIKIPEQKIIQSIPSLININFMRLIHAILILNSINLTVIAACLIWWAFQH